MHLSVEQYRETRRREHLARRDLWVDAHTALVAIRHRVLAHKGAPIGAAVAGTDSANDLLNRFRLGRCLKLAEEFDADTGSRLFGDYPVSLPTKTNYTAPPLETPLDFCKALAGKYHCFAKALYVLGRRIELDFNKSTPTVDVMFEAIRHALTLRLRPGLESLIPAVHRDNPEILQLWPLTGDDLSRPLDARTLMSERDAESMLGLPHLSKRDVEDRQ